MPPKVEYNLKNKYDDELTRTPCFLFARSDLW